MPKTGGGFYNTPAWKALRKQALMRDHWRCTVCGIPVANPGEARVDHIKPVRTHPHLALTLANLRTLCAQHDNQAHREKWRGRGGSGTREERFVITGSDADGVPLDPRHHWRRPPPGTI